MVILAATSAALAARVPETRPEPDPTLQTAAPLVQRAAVVPGAALFCGVAATSGFLAFAVPHARQVGLDAWGAVLLVFGGTVVACRLAFATLPDTMAPRRLTVAALVVCAAGFVTVGVLRTAAGLVAGAVVLAVGTAFLTPAVFAAVFRAVPPAERGSAAATTSVFIDLGLSGGPLLVGFLAAWSSIPTAFLLAAVVPVAGGLLLASTDRRGAGS